MGADIIEKVEFISNPVIKGREDRYQTVTINIPRIIESWRKSLFSFEWMLPDGRIKSRDELPEKEQPKRDEIEARIAAGQHLEIPVLGIGLLENVEIGTGRAILLTLAARGLEAMPAHIPVSHREEFEDFIQS